MEAHEWNARHEVGTEVILTRADGKQLRTRTRTPAQRVGQFAMVEVEAIQPGLVLLSWCRAIGRGPDHGGKG